MVVDIKTHTLDTAEADIVYDVQGPLPTADGRAALFMIGQPNGRQRFPHTGVVLPRPHRDHL